MVQKSFIWVSSVFELLTVMFARWLRWTVVVDHCLCRSGAPCHIWQQSDMVIESWGYEWLGVGSLEQTNSINSSFRAAVSCKAPAGSWQDISARAQTRASANSPHAVFMYFKVTFSLIRLKRRKMEETQATFQSKLLKCCLRCRYLQLSTTLLYTPLLKCEFIC